MVIPNHLQREIKKDTGTFLYRQVSLDKIATSLPTCRLRRVAVGASFAVSISFRPAAAAATAGSYSMFALEPIISWHTTRETSCAPSDISDLFHLLWRLLQPVACMFESRARRRKQIELLAWNLRRGRLMTTMIRIPFTSWTNDRISYRNKIGSELPPTHLHWRIPVC